MRSRPVTPNTALRARRAASRAAHAVSHAFGALDHFIAEFADSAREVNRAMARARAERHTISAHRR